MAVIARSAATDGGKASRECIFRDRRSGFSDYTLPCLRSLVACGRFLSFDPRMRITTSEEGVVGLDPSFDILVEGMSL